MADVVLEAVALRDRARDDGNSAWCRFAQALISPSPNSAAGVSMSARSWWWVFAASIHRQFRSWIAKASRRMTWGVARFQHSRSRSGYDATSIRMSV